MSISMYSQTVPVFVKLMTNAKTWMTKADAFAQAKGFDATVLSHARLAPDMFPFNRQIHIATDGAKAGVGRLAGVDIPKYDDVEVTFAELAARLDKCIAFVSGFTPAQLDGTEGKEIVLPSRQGEIRTNGLDYLRYRVQPNFFFHMTTAYAILRHNGVDVGKGDFLPPA